MTFEWIDCSFFLKKNVGGSEVTINLTPYHRLQLVHENQQTNQLEFTLTVDFERSLMYDPAIGWNWHKSWTIPDITVELEACSIDWPSTRVNTLKNLYAEVYIVKPIISKEYSLCVEDLGLDGNTCFELVDGKCTFSGLKFAATSYNNEGSKFHFLLTVYDKSEREGEPSKILLSRISTPIFAELIKLKKLSAYIEPFEVASLHKRFVKKQSKKSRGYAEQQIENNLSGLYNYFGAANIRNKVKHPLFLAAKFSECFFIYYRREALEPGQTVLHLLQSALMTIYQTINSYHPPSKLANKKIVLFVKSENLMGRVSQQKRIPDFLEPIICEDLGCLVEESSLPMGFEHLKITTELLQLYGRLLPELQKTHNGVYNEYEQELKQQAAPQKKCEIAAQGEIVSQQEPRPARNEDRPDITEYENELLKGADEYQEESVSSYSLSNNFPDVPLKCEMVVDPVRHRPVKLWKLIAANQHSSNYVFCEKRLLSNAKQLTILNQLIRMDIEQKKSTLKRKHLEREEAARSAMLQPFTGMPLLTGFLN